MEKEGKLSFTRKCGEEYKVVLARKKRKHGSYECYDFTVVSEYRPDAINKYLRSPKKTCKKSNLLDKARKHLSFLGWKFWSKIKNGNDEWRYESPTSGKTYYSMMMVCEAFEKGEEVNTLSIDQQKVEDDTDEDEDLDIRKRKVRKVRVACSLSSEDEREMEQVSDDTEDDEHYYEKWRSISQKRKDLGHNSSQMRRSSRTASKSQVPRTVLSWLIENNVVLPRSKIFYHEENSVEPLAEGKIVGDVIRCGCCSKWFSLSGFQAHVSGNNILRPAENMFLEDGKSLVSCQVELMKKNMMRLWLEPVEHAMGTRPENCNDHICSICQYGGKLIMCDRCPSSFHATCLNLENVPEGDWFCPSCCCGICGDSQFDMTKEQFNDDSLLCCHQCERRYHARCKKDRGMASPGEDWFCSKTCEMTHWGLQQLLGKPFVVGDDNLTWTLVKPMEYQTEDHEDYDWVAMAENYSKLSIALEVMHECFEPVKDLRTRRDLVEDVLFCRGSNLKRLNFKGFYTVLLERNDELIAVAILRVFGDKVAEIPLIGTRFQHRHLGMCRVLMNEIEKNLLNLGVQQLVLPASPSVLNTWTTSFGFSPITESDRSEFLGYTFLDFQDTIMCQKLLRKLPSPRIHLSRNTEGSISILDHEGNCSLSSVFQDQHEGSDPVDQSAHVNVTKEKLNGSSNQDKPFSTLEFMDHKKIEPNKSRRTLKFFIRKKETDCSKFEVSCR